MTGDLAARLLAAIEETEDDAKAAMDAPGVDQWMWDGYLYEGDGGAWSGLDPLARNGQRLGAHVARQDPKATLIRCAADRKIVERHSAHSIFERTGQENVEVCDYCSHDPSGWGPWREWPCPDLLDIAESYGLSTGVDDECE